MNMNRAMQAQHSNTGEWKVLKKIIFNNQNGTSYCNNKSINFFQTQHAQLYIFSQGCDKKFKKLIFTKPAVINI
jgi:Pyruvate/2-oxoacid:ferredoxin oxidoreductase delta subunit